MKALRHAIALLILPTLSFAQPYTAQQEQDRLINFGMSSELAVELTDYVNGDGLISILLPNNTYLKARNAAGTADLDILKADATDDTVLNADTADVIKLAIAGTTEVTVDNDLIAFSGTTGTLQSAGSLIVKLSADAQRLITYAAASDTAITQKYGDAGVTATQTFGLSGSAADGDDDSTTSLCGGGACTGDATRGAIIVLKGNEASGAGDLQMLAGDTDGSTISINTNHANGTINLRSGAATQALVLETDQDATFASEITSTETGSLGWSYVTGANTACTTTCTFAAVFGVDLAAGASQPVLVGPSSATADACICAGAN